MSSAFCSKIYQCKCKNKDWCAKDYNPELDDYECFEPMTNADRIRAMTNEELAKNLSELFGECAFVHIPHREGTVPPCSFYDFDCGKCWLDWLKLEVSDD